MAERKDSNVHEVRWWLKMEGLQTWHCVKFIMTLLHGSSYTRFKISSLIVLYYNTLLLMSPLSKIYMHHSSSHAHSSKAEINNSCGYSAYLQLRKVHFLLSSTANIFWHSLREVYDTVTSHDHFLECQLWIHTCNRIIIFLCSNFLSISR